MGLPPPTLQFATGRGARAAGRGSHEKVAPAVAGPPLVSVLVRAAPPHLDEALASVLVQSYSDFEVVVVQRATGEQANLGWGADIEGRVRLIQLPQWAKPGALWNAALESARGSYVAFLDGADRYLPDHLATAIGALAAGGHGAPLVYTAAARAHKLWREGRLEVLKRDQLPSEDFDADRLLFENYVPLSCVVLERVALETVGRFDESLEHCEDWDLWIRLSRVRDLRHVARPTCELTRMLDGRRATGAEVAAVLKAENRVRAKHHTLMRRSRYAHQIYPFLAQRVSQLLDLGHEAEALEVLTDLLGWEPENGAARRDLAYLHAAKGEPERAVALLRDQLVPSEERTGSAERARVEELARHGQLAEAQRLQEELLAHDPGDAMGYNDLGVLAFQLGHKDKARSLLELAVRLDPRNAAAFKNLAHVCLDAGERVEALGHCLTALFFSPGDPEALAMKTQLCGRPLSPRRSDAVCLPA